MDEKEDLAKQYQEILDQYSQELVKEKSISVPETQETPQIIADNPPEVPVIDSSIEIDPIKDTPLVEAPLPPPISETEVPLPDSIAPEIPLPPPPTPELPLEPVTDIPQATSGKFFKILFFISLLIFLGVSGTIIYSIINSSRNGNQNSSPTPTSKLPSPTISSNVCRVNDQTYQINQSFKAADGCNTCSCTPNLAITCTQLACETTPTATASADLTPEPPPEDLINLVKSTVASEAKTTIDKVVIGEVTVAGDYAQVAYGFNPPESGAVYWAAKVDGSWKIVTGGQEPPSCSVLAPYKFPSSFACNK